jgi:hypothetical protein
MSTVQFTVLKAAVQQAYEAIKTLPLFASNATKDELWDVYIMKLTALGHNEIYRERGEHDCQCCKAFIRKVGNIVAIKDGQLVSIWDEINTGTYYDDLAATMSALVKNAGIRSIFLSDTEKVGTDSNVEIMDDGNTHVWEHFYLELNPALHVETNGDRRRHIVGRAGNHYASLKLSCEQLTLDAVNTVLDLVNDNNLYRGTEHKSTLELMRDVLTEYNSMDDASLWLWTKSRQLGSLATLRSTVIGTLVKDISSGMDLEQAVNSFEAKVAPHNYKRSSKVITKGMIEAAENKVKELGIEESLPRRPALITDITVNNVLWADAGAEAAMGGIFGDLKDAAKDTNVDLTKATAIGINDFMTKVLPSAKAVELLLENRLADTNAMTLVAPVDADAPSIFKWDNNFSWTYKGDVTDGIAEKVKKAGGKIDGAMRISLAWDNSDDLDLHINCPQNGHIFFGSRRSKRGLPMLDVDMNSERMNDKDPVENICYHEDRDIPRNQWITVKVNQYSRRGQSTEGFTVEIEIDGKIFSFFHRGALGNARTKQICRFKVDRNNQVEFSADSMDRTDSSRNTWGLSTQKFHRVQTVMHSPNHWDGNSTGNKHTFFILDNFVNPDAVRGFYNEFLSAELHENRKVFEVLGNRMKAQPIEGQLNGIGFSETVRNNVYLKVDGRLYQVSF